MNDNRDISESRALVPIPERALAPVRRWLPMPVTRRTAIVTAVGAASAVGTFFLKRLGELVAEDVYRRIKHAAVPTLDPNASSPARPAEIIPDSPTDSDSADDRSLLVRLVSVERVAHGPYFRQRMRIRQRRFDLQDGTPDE